MVVLSKTVKLLLGSGLLLVALWVALLMFSASSIKVETSNQPLKQVLPLSFNSLTLNSESCIICFFNSASQWI